MIFIVFKAVALTTHAFIALYTRKTSSRTIVKQANH